jgi:hypothetical protein
LGPFAPGLALGKPFAGAGLEFARSDVAISHTIS